MRSIGLGRPMGLDTRWRPGSCGPPGCGIPKVPHRTFGAEGVHRGSGASGPCATTAKRSGKARLQPCNPTQSWWNTPGPSVRSKVWDPK